MKSKAGDEYWTIWNRMPRCVDCLKRVPQPWYGPYEVCPKCGGEIVFLVGRKRWRVTQPEGWFSEEKRHIVKVEWREPKKRNAEES